MEKVKNLLLRCLRMVQKSKIRGLMAKQQDARQRKDLMDRWKKILRSIRQWQKTRNWNFPLARWKKVCRCLEGRQTARKGRILSCFRIKAFGRMGVRKENKMVGRASKRKRSLIKYMMVLRFYLIHRLSFYSLDISLFYVFMTCFKNWRVYSNSITQYIIYCRTW